MIKVSDSVGRLLQTKNIKKIVSLVPSWTEYLIFLGLNEKLIGRTKFCIYPKNIVESIPKLGGTKNPDIDKIISLNPDLVIANKEENKLFDINRLRATNISVLTTSAIRLGEALDELELIEFLLTHSIDKSLTISKKANRYITNSTIYSFIYLIWKDPYMCAGPNTYINSVIENAGGKNLISKSEERYPKLTIEEIIEMNPDKIFLPDEPYDFHNISLNEFVDNFSEDQIILVDGTLASWYNHRIVDGLKFYGTI